jgi:PAS domain-containing protein
MTVLSLAHSASLPWQCLAGAVAALATLAVVCARRSKTAIRREYERNLRDQARLRMVIEQLPTIFWTTDADLRFTSCDGKGLVGLDGLPPRLVGMTFREYFGSADPTFEPIANHLAALRGESRNYEFFWNNRTFLVHCEPLRDAGGRIIGTVGVSSDISSRKAAEQALAQSEAKNRALLTAIPDVMFRLTQGGTLVEFIDKLLAPSEDYAGRNVRDVFPSGVAALFLEAARSAVNTGATQIFEYETGAPGHRRTFEARVVAYGGGDEALAIVRNVTPWRKLQPRPDDRSRIPQTT